MKKNMRSAEHRREVAMVVERGRPPMYTDPAELEAKFDEYFARQDKEGRPYTIAGLCLAAGFSSRQSLHDYLAKPEFVDVIKRAKLRVEEFLNEKLLAGQGMVAGPIFNLKNLEPAYWRDKHESEVSINSEAQVGLGLALMPPEPKDMLEWQQWYRQVMDQREAERAMLAAEEQS